MTNLIKCDGCGKIQEAGLNGSNPINPITGQKWYSKTDNGKELHACQRSCIPKNELISPI